MKRSVHLDRLLQIETQLTGLHGLMMEAQEQERYASVLSLLEPVLYEIQDLAGAMHKDPQSKFELKQGGAQ